MDLKAILAANKSKAGKTTSDQSTHKTIDIDSEDRPYSIHGTENTPASAMISNDTLDTQKGLTERNQSAGRAVELNMPSPSPIETSLTESIKTDNKLTTNWQQIENKPATNRKQSDNKLATKSEQAVNKIANEKQNWQQSGNATGNKTDNKVVTKWQQTDNKVATTMPFSKLVGLQREIVIFMCHECKNSRSRTTEALTLEYIENSLKHSAGAIKTTIQRLEKKGCIARVEFKNGRGGWSRYELPDSIYHDVIRSESDNKLATNREQTGNKVASQPATEPATSASCSSSFKDLKTTTTEIGDEWNFDITPYAHFGFSKTQVKQLATSGVISAADVEQSLIEFSYDLDNNALPSIKTTKINFLMGLLWKGQSYVSEGFKNEHEAMIAEMARRAAEKRENLMKAKFEAWEAGLGDDERKVIESKLPTHLTVLHRTYGVSNTEVKKWYFDYFMRNVTQ